MWENYTVSADLVFPDKGTTTGLSVYVGNLSHEVVLSVNRGYYSISFADSEIDTSAGDLPDSDAYHVDVNVSPTQVSCAINGEPMPPVSIGPPSGPRTIAGGIGIISHRTTNASPVSIVDNLVIQ
jgi:hypothetical protein